MTPSHAARHAGITPLTAQGRERLRNRYQFMGLMTKKRIRHVPVVSESRLVGMVSIGDLVKNQCDRLAMENQFMKDYIQS